MIPEAWEVVPVGDLFTFKNGLNKAKQFFGRGTPIVNYMDVFGKPSLRIGEVVGQVDVSPKELKAYNVRKGDVFFTRTSETVEEIGTASVMLDEPESTVYSGFVLRARPTNDSLDDNFKAYCFSPRYFRKQIIARASYTTRALTNGRSLSVSLLARPPLPEQRAIATALSDVDALLGGLDRLIAKKRDLKQAAMQQLLTGQTRLPGFHGEWEVTTLGKIAAFFKGKGLPKMDIDPYGAEACIHYGELFTQYHEEIYETFSRTNLSHDCVWSVTNDVLMPTSDVTPRGLAKASCVLLDGVIIGGDILIIRADRSRAFGPFLSHIIRREETQILQLVTGTTVYHLYASDMKKFVFRLPPVSEQGAIATVLADMDAEIATLKQLRDKTHALKQAMMQELLTGRTGLVPAGAVHA